jgi:hypothetical protein
VQHTQGRWRGPCEHCADPDCELRLFTELLPDAAAAPTRPRSTAPSSSMAAGLPPG